jgi:type VI secretion system protein ImpG
MERRSKFYCRTIKRTNSPFLQLEVTGSGLSGWHATSLRLFLADDYPAACDLYQLLLRSLKRISITSQENGAVIEIPSGNLKPVGFADQEALLRPEIGFMPGHLMLQEYFLFPDKFLFLDLTGLDKCRTLGSGSRFEIRFELTSCPLVVPRVNEKSFALFATPVINLFKHKAQPVSFVSELQQHQVRPGGEHSAHFQIYSVDSVEGLVKTKSKKISYGVHNPMRQGSKDSHLCHITQSKSPLRNGLDTFLSIPCHKDQKQTDRIKLDIDLTCTNGILPEQLNIGDVCSAAMAVPESVEPRNITAVTAAIFPEIQQNRQWRLLAGFSLNSASLVTAENFRAILSLFLQSGSRQLAGVMASGKRIDAIASIAAKPADRLIGRTIYRGYDVRLKLRGDQFTSPGDLYLFSAVLERFLGGYVTQNCFIRLVVEEIGKGYRFEWPARMGDRCVL